MSAKAFRLICLLSVLLVTGPVLAQEGHPAKGTWVGRPNTKSWTSIARVFSGASAAISSLLRGT